MNYEYKIIEDEYLGKCIYEFQDKSTNFRIELSSLKESVDSLPKLTSYGKIKFKRCQNWLKENHPEWLI